MVVDVTNRFVGLPTSLDESLAVYPKSVGPAAFPTIERARRVLEAFRAAGLPVVFSVRNEQPGVQDHLRRKEAAGAEEPARANEVVASLEPRAGESVLGKAKPSAFFGTPLASILVSRRVDTVVICGGVTSGCVRASAVDAFSLGYRVVVAEDAVFDRNELSHAVALFDLSQKYAEVVPAAEVVSWLGGPGVAVPPPEASRA